MAGHAGEFSIRAGQVQVEPARSTPSLALRREPARSNVLQFAARHPEPGMAPGEALSRVRVAGIVVAAAACVVAVLSSVELGRPALMYGAACWLAVEVVVANLYRHLDETGSVRSVLRRHVFYGMSACVLGVLADDPHSSVRALGLLAFFAGVQVSAAVLLRTPGSRRVIGITAAPSVLIVADRSTAEDAVEDRAGLTSSTVVGVCLVEGAENVSSVGGVPVLGSIDDVVTLAADLNIHEVAVRLEKPLDSEWLRQLEWSLEGLGARLTLVTKLRNTRAGRVRVSRVGNSIVLGVSQSRPTGLVRHAKSVGETAIACLCLVVALPVLLACALAVKLDTPGPVFFWQTRVRDGNRTFRMLKLRTMVVDAEGQRAQLEAANEVAGGGLFKIKEDPRITRVGRVLRKLSLDELPQLFNVICGRMSLIGPRPALPCEVERYDGVARRRLSVKPGLTGLWQVSGRSKLSWDEAIALDVDYVDNWSAGLDLRIAMETVRAVAAKDGAY